MTVICGAILDSLCGIFVDSAVNKYHAQGCQNQACELIKHPNKSTTLCNLPSSSNKPKKWATLVAFLELSTVPCAGLCLCGTIKTIFVSAKQILLRSPDYNHIHPSEFERRCAGAALLYICSYGLVEYLTWFPYARACQCMMFIRVTWLKSQQPSTCSRAGTCIYYANEPDLLTMTLSDTYLPTAVCMWKQQRIYHGGLHRF